MRFRGIDSWVTTSATFKSNSILADGSYPFLQISARIFLIGPRKRDIVGGNSARPLIGWMTTPNSFRVFLHISNSSPAPWYSKRIHIKGCIAQEKVWLGVNALGLQLRNTIDELYEFKLSNRSHVTALLKITLVISCKSPRIGGLKHLRCELGASGNHSYN